MATPASLKIRASSPGDAGTIADFWQPIFTAVYPNAKYGMKPEHFSPAIFHTADTFDYLRKTLSNGPNQRAYLAELDSQVVGTITIERLPDRYELHGFYVGLKFQGQGIGRQLLREALKFHAGDRPLRVEVAESSLQSIAMYQHWGFQSAPQYGIKFRHWPEWPEGLENGYIYLEATKEQLRV